MNPWLRLWEQNHLWQINLTCQWDCSTAGWSRGRSWILFFQHVQEKHEVCRKKKQLVKSESFWVFLGLPSGKSLHQKNPSGNSTRWEELLTLCQPKSVYGILLQPKRLLRFAFSRNTWEQQRGEALTVLFHSIFQFCPLLREQEVTPKQTGFLVLLGFFTKLPSLSFNKTCCWKGDKISPPLKTFSCPGKETGGLQKRFFFKKK